MLQPTSLVVCFLLGIVACVLGVVVTRLIGRESRGKRITAGLLLPVVPLLGIGMILVAANHNLEYAQDWRTVYHIVKGGKIKAKAEPMPAVIPAYNNVAPAINQPSGEEWKITTEPAKYGTVLTHFHGPNSGINQRVWIWVPKDYDPAKTYRALIMLQGYPSHTEKIPGSLNFDENLPKIAPNTIVAVPDLAINVLPPNCVDFRGVEPIGTYITKDIVGMLRANYSVSDKREDWAIGGASYGGWCAPVLGLQNPQTFGSIISFSGYNVPDIGLAATTPELKEEFTVTNMMHDATWPQSVYMTGTKSDPASTKFINQAAHVNNPALHLNFMVDDKGAHTWDVWGRQFPAAMEWWVGGQPENSVTADEHEHVTQDKSFITSTTFVGMWFIVFIAGTLLLVWRGKNMKAWGRGTSVAALSLCAILGVLFLANLSTYTVTHITNLHGFFNLFR